MKNITLRVLLFLLSFVPAIASAGSCASTTNPKLHRDAVCADTANIAPSNRPETIELSQNGAGAVAAKVTAKIRERASIKDFGAAGDGVTNDFDAFRLAAASLTDNSTVAFPPGEYLISYSGGYKPEKIHGEIAFPIFNVKNVKIVSEGATIKIAGHNITTNSGLTVFGYDGTQGLEISGFRFDLNYTGRNDSDAYYPFNGAIVGRDTSGTAGSRTGRQLSSGININRNTFNIYHPFGAYSTALKSYRRDPNNGFKIFSFTAFGDTLATARANQNADVQFNNNRFVATHNAYGVWIWAYNNALVSQNVADSWANHSTDARGKIRGGYIPFIRYQQFYTSGMIASNNRMNARPMKDRVGGYAGTAGFADLTTNNTDDLNHGETSCVSNQLSLRTGDSGILVGVYGVANIADNIVNGVDIADRPVAGIDLQPGRNGKAYYKIQGNSTNRLFSAPLVRVNSGAPLKENRRLKVLTIKNNTSLNSFGAAISFVNTEAATTFGVEKMYVLNNVFDGEASQFSHANTNNSAIYAEGSTEATDRYYIQDNKIRYFYNLEKSGRAVAKVTGNIGDHVSSSSNYNYFQTIHHVRKSKTVAAGGVPRVGTSNKELFSYTARRVVLSSAAIQQTLSGEVAGGTSIAGATPAGEAWYIDQVLIAKKGF